MKSYDNKENNFVAITFVNFKQVDIKNMVPAVEVFKNDSNGNYIILASHSINIPVMWTQFEDLQMIKV